MRFYRIFAAGVSAVALLGLAACGNHDDKDDSVLSISTDSKTKTETRTVGAYSKIVVRGAVKLEVETGDTASLSVEGAEKVLERLTTTVEDDTLVIDMTNHEKKVIVFNDNGITVRIVAPKIEGLKVEGAVDAHFKGLKAERFDLDVEGAGNIELQGSCGKADFTAEGAANINAEKFECKEVAVRMSGAGNADVFASDAVDARLEGIGNIDVFGGPKTVNQTRDGIGKIDIHDAPGGGGPVDGKPLI